MWWRVQPGHVDFGRTLVDRQILVVRAARAAKLQVIALISAATATGEQIQVSRVSIESICSQFSDSNWWASIFKSLAFGQQEGFSQYCRWKSQKHALDLHSIPVGAVVVSVTDEQLTVRAQDAQWDLLVNPTASIDTTVAAHHRRNVGIPLIG